MAAGSNSWRFPEVFSAQWSFYFIQIPYLIVVIIIIIVKILKPWDTCK